MRIPKPHAKKEQIYGKLKTLILELHLNIRQEKMLVPTCPAAESPSSKLHTKIPILSTQSPPDLWLNKESGHIQDKLTIIIS